MPTSTKKLKACLLPLNAIDTLAQLTDFWEFIRQASPNQKFNAWSVLPIHPSTTLSPFRGAGFGVDISSTLATEVLSLYPTSKIARWRHELALSEADWLENYAFFEALANNFHSRFWWRDWPLSLRTRQPQTLLQFQKLLQSEIALHYQKQLDSLVAFHALSAWTRHNRFSLIGDLPFYLGLETFAVWSWPNLFQLDPQTLRPNFLSGVPASIDDPFGRQYWGHPLYNWSSTSSSSLLSTQNVALLNFFARRLQHLKTLGFDLVRFDHANGLFYYGSLDPHHSHNHLHDRWYQGPGQVAFDFLLNFSEKIQLPIFWENLATNKKLLEKSLAENNQLGIKTLTLSETATHRLTLKNIQFVDPDNKKVVFYTSSHDSQTLLTWLTHLPLVRRLQLTQLNHLPENLSSDPRQLAAALIKLLLTKSPSPIIIIPAWDLRFETQRLNTPGTNDAQNWQYSWT